MAEKMFKKLIIIEQEAIENVEKAKKMAENIKNEARKEAEKIIKNAEKEAACLEDKIYQEMLHKIKQEEIKTEKELKDALREYEFRFKKKKRKLIDMIKNSVMEVE